MLRAVVPSAEELSNFGIVAQPDHDVRCSSVYGPHLSDLMISLSDATLINADSIYPEESQRVFLSHDAQKVVQILPDEKQLIVDEDWIRRTFVSPGIRQACIPVVSTPVCKSALYEALWR